GFYANALHITPDYLNKVCRRVYGLSPKMLIEQQLVVEMKSYLTDTHLSVSDIAVRLNFEDVSYMCRFFRRLVGCSPLAFRNGVKSW
ncbi:MAG: helix-turn-helix transcriptional regulator, partial [Odoribacter sp.]|nr:helix-turn-helix transcriptional regulator [Odoribacter sp.]